MDLLEDPVFKNKYQKSKLRVKLWESDFMENYGRKPNKNDIREADATIREAYKMYWKLKTRALEETLMDITFTDDVQANISASSVTASVTSEAQDKVPSDPIDVGDTENRKPEVAKTNKKTEFDAVVSTDVINSQGVWGEHLNKTKAVEPKKKQNLLVGRSSSFQLSQKMFESTSFTKRNPRKSLSSAKLRTKSEIIPDQSTQSTMNETSRVMDGFDPNDLIKPIIGDQLKVVQTENKLVSKSVSAVHELLEGRAINARRSIDSGWLKRCSERNNLEPSASDLMRFSGTSDSGFDSLESSVYSPYALSVMSSQVSLPISDEEDFVCNSDSESEHRNKRVRNVKRSVSNDANPAVKRPCIESYRSALTSPQASLELIENQSTPETRPNKLASSIDLVEPLPSSINLVEPLQNNVKISALAPQNCGDNEAEEHKNDIACNNNTDNNHVPEIIDRRKISFNNESTPPTIESSTESKLQESQPLERSTQKSSTARRTQRKPYRRIQKNNSPSESDNESSKEQIIEKTRKTRATKRQTTKAKKETKSTKTEVNKDVDTEKKTPKIKKTRASKVTKTPKAKSTKVAKTDDDDPGEIPQIPFYPVDSLNAVPRFSLPEMGTGDLINDFTQMVAVDSDKSAVLAKSKKTKKPVTAEEKLEKKIADGKMNENFVRINLKKKVFVRGKKTMTFQKYKKNQWKQKKKELASGEGSLDLADLVEKKGVLTCFKCGDVGHFSKECRSLKSDALLPLTGVDDTSVYPTLEEAEKMALDNVLSAHKHRLNLIPQTAGCSYKSSLVPKTDADLPPIDLDGKKTIKPQLDDHADLLDDIDFSEELKYEEAETKVSTQHTVPEHLVAKLLPAPVGPVQPLYDTTSVTGPQNAPTEVIEALNMFGYETFRPGQEKAIMRVLSGKSTLVTLSTGSGKSLCYQLPAYLYARRTHCITLVISPLVSLMDDQVTGVPKFLSVACLHTAQSSKQKSKVMEMVKAGTLNILLVSPEAVVAGEKSTGFGALLRQLPPIAFACIDEAHCISQWSHNFRPSYLMVCKVLREKLGVQNILGLTATATKSTAENIVNYLNIPDGMDGVISDIPLPRNLTLTVSKDPNRDRALIALLESDRFKDLNSLIVYCTRRDECVRVAGVLRTSLWDPEKHAKTKDNISSIVEAYHAGLPASRRKMVQKLFMNDKIRIVVATVAFGMGINKSDIGAVIHFNMPSSFEGYVQEVGRAGRDGEPAHCHLFISPQEASDKSELRRHIYANGVDRHMIRRLLQQVFVPCGCKENRDTNSKQHCPGHEVAIPVDDIVKTLDIPQEIISTLLCYLELHPKKYITNLSSAYVNAKVTSYNGPRALKTAAQCSPPLAMAIALDMKRGINHDDSSIIEFPVIDVAAAIGWDSGVVKGQLKNLEWQQTDGGAWKRTAISVTFDTLGFRVRAPGDLSEGELDEALEVLTKRTSEQQHMNLCQLETIHTALTNVALESVRQCQELTEDVTRKSDALKTVIRSYFQTDDPMKNIDLRLETKLTNEAQIASDVRQLVHCYRDNNFTGRAVARIFHGIQSPNYSALVWSRCRFWRAHLTANFELICQVATREILAMRA